MENEKYWWLPIVCPCCHTAVIHLKKEEDSVATFECVGCQIEFDIRNKK